MSIAKLVPGETHQTPPHQVTVATVGGFAEYAFHSVITEHFKKFRCLLEVLDLARLEVRENGVLVCGGDAQKSASESPLCMAVQRATPAAIKRRLVRERFNQ